MQYVNYRENRQRGTLDFPLEYHHVTVNHPQYEMNLHWHVEFELIRVLKNSLIFTIDEQHFTAGEGAVIFVPAGSLHSGVPQDCIYECIVFDINMLMNNNDSCCELVNKIINHKVELRNHFTASFPDIHQIIWAMFDCVATKMPGYQMLAAGALYQFFGTIFARHYYKEVPEQPPKNHKRIVQLKTALEFIEAHFSQALSLEEISDSVQMSPKYFCRFFHEMTNRTPIEYLNYYRIERACYQLLTSDDSITEVAFESGFNDLSYFIKTFKKYKGRTPKQYLKS